MRSWSRKQTALEIKRVLTAAFPVVKFSVRSESYAGGGAIRVHWTDGPTTLVVDKFVSRFQDVSFDGMIDLQSYVDPRMYKGEVTDFNSGYVTTSRSLSRATYEAAAKQVEEFTGVKVEIVESSCGGGCWAKHVDVQVPARAHIDYDTKAATLSINTYEGSWASQLVDQIAHHMSLAEAVPGTNPWEAPVATTKAA